MLQRKMEIFSMPSQIRSFIRAPPQDYKVQISVPYPLALPEIFSVHTLGLAPFSISSKLALISATASSQTFLHKALRSS